MKYIHRQKAYMEQAHWRKSKPSQGTNKLNQCTIISKRSKLHPQDLRSIRENHYDIKSKHVETNSRHTHQETRADPTQWAKKNNKLRWYMRNNLKDDESNNQENRNPLMGKVTNTKNRRWKNPGSHCYMKKRVGKSKKCVIQQIKELTLW